MTVNLGTAYIEIEPDFDAFDRRVAASLPTLSRRMQGLSTSSDRAHTTTSRLSSATAGLGSALTGAAAAAGAALAAYLSISQAKAAISTTTDLAKVTAGLSRNLGLSTKAASRWGAVAYAREIDTKSLTMAFTTLSRQLTEAGRGSETAVQAFEDIGITQRDLTKTGGDFQKQLMLVAEGFGEAEGGAKRQQAAQKLLGRGYQTLLPLFAEGRDSLKEQLHWADKYGVTLDKKTTKSVMDFVTAQRESRVAWLGLQKNFSVAVMPLLKDAQEQFQHLAHIVNNPKLSPEEKWDKALQMITHLLKKWGSKAVELAWDIGKDMAGAMFDAFVDEVEGTAFGKVDFFDSDAFHDQLEGFLGDIEGMTHQSIYKQIKLWREAGLKVNEETIYTWQQQGLITSRGAVDLLAVLEKLQRKYRKAFDQLSHATTKTGHDLKDFTGDAAGWLDKWADRGGDDIDRLADAFFPFGKAIRGTKEDIRDFVKDTTKMLDRFIDKGKSVEDKVGDSFMGLASVVTHGLDIIIDNTNKALKGFGVKKVAISLAGAGAAASDFAGHQHGGVIVPGQGSGDKVPAMLEPGEVVWNREAVKAYFGSADRANQINKLIPRFASGGVIQQALGPYSIPPIVYDPNHAGGNSHLHLDFFTKSQAIAYGKKMQGMGWTIGEYSGPYGGFGGITTQHQSPGHYDGTAFDANTPEDETRSQVAAVARLLGSGKVGAAVAEKIARVILKGPDGPLKSIGQAALDKARAAANKYIAAKAPNGEMGPGSPMKGLPKALQKYNQVYPVSSGFGDGYAMPFNAVAALAEWAGAPGISMARTAIGESQLEPGAIGYDPGGTRGLGLWMITTGFNDALISKLGGESRMRNPVINAQAMNTILDAQGIGAWYSSTKDSSGTHYHGPLLRQRGGIIGLQKGGDPKKDGKLGGSATPGGLDPDFKRLRRVRQIMARIAELVGEKGKAARLEETIGRVESLAGLESSPFGSELSPAELARQISLNEKLLETLVRARKLTGSGLRLANRKPYSKVGDKQFKGVRTNLGATMLDLAGLTGKGGRIFDTKLHLAELKGTTVGTAATPVDISGLRSVIEAARYGVFDNQLPRFHEGGIYRAPPGRNEGAVVLSDGERVTPAGETFVGYATIQIGDETVAERVRMEFDRRGHTAHVAARAYRR